MHISSMFRQRTQPARDQPLHRRDGVFVRLARSGGVSQPRLPAPSSTPGVCQHFSSAYEASLLDKRSRNYLRKRLARPAGNSTKRQGSSCRWSGAPRLKYQPQLRIRLAVVISAAAPCRRLWISARPAQPRGSRDESTRRIIGIIPAHGAPNDHHQYPQHRHFGSAQPVADGSAAAAQQDRQLQPEQRQTRSSAATRGAATLANQG